MGRKKLHVDESARQKAYRERYAVVQVRFPKERLETLDEIAAELGMPRTEVVNSLINFALLNYNWRVLGLFGKRLPHAYDPQKGN